VRICACGCGRELPARHHGLRLYAYASCSVRAERDARRRRRAQRVAARDALLATPSGGATGWGRSVEVMHLADDEEEPHRPGAAYCGCRVCSRANRVHCRPDPLCVCSACQAGRARGYRSRRRVLVCPARGQPRQRQPDPRCVCPACQLGRTAGLEEGPPCSDRETWPVRRRTRKAPARRVELVFARRAS